MSGKGRVCQRDLPCSKKNTGKESKVMLLQRAKINVQSTL